MKNFVNKMLFGEDNKFSGAIALFVVALVALGCTCNKSFDLSNSQSNTDSNQPAPKSTDKSADYSTTPRKTSADKADASKAEMPSDDELQKKVKETLLEFNDAVQNDDFASFHETICEPWKKQVTAETLRDSFKAFVEKDVDISTIGSLDAKFSPEPEIGREVGYKTLKITGQYPTRPNQTKFEINYIPEGKEWKLSKIIVDTTQKN